jgi:uncharacterized protein YkwD
MALEIILPIVLGVGLLVTMLLLRKKDKEVKEELNPYEVTDENRIDYTPTVDGLTQFEQGLFDVVNKHRVSIGLNELVSDRAARDMAYEHTKFMISEGEISHKNIVPRRFELYKRGGSKYGETVAYAYSTAQSFLRAYLRSETHKEILNYEGFTHIGVRVLKDKNNRYYNTLSFIIY